MHMSPIMIRSGVSLTCLFQSNSQVWTAPIILCWIFDSLTTSPPLPSLPPISVFFFTSNKLLVVVAERHGSEEEALDNYCPCHHYHLAWGASACDEDCGGCWPWHYPHQLPWGEAMSPPLWFLPSRQNRPNIMLPTTCSHTSLSPPPPLPLHLSHLTIVDFSVTQHVTMH